LNALEVGAARAWILAFIVMAGIGIGTLVGVGCLVGANTCPGRSRPKQTSTDGATLFVANCAICHGRSGEGTRAAPSLVTGEAKGLTLDQIRSRIERGKPLGPRGSMPRFSGTLSSEQIDAVARYVVTLRGGS
jgi:mono/diheme cytochrome c family protein